MGLVMINGVPVVSRRCRRCPPVRAPLASDPGVSAQDVSWAQHIASTLKRVSLFSDDSRATPVKRFGTEATSKTALSSCFLSIA